MAEIKASDVKALREKTGAGMMDCKDALAKSNGDFAAAEKLLKEKGLAAMEKRLDRATNEGKIFAKLDGKKAVIVELTCETDFVARNPDFIALGKQVADIALAKGLSAPNDELNGLVTDLATKIRENMSLKRLALVQAGEGECIHEYLHGDKIGVIIKMKASPASVLEKPEVAALTHDLALHIAAFNPQFLDRTKVNPVYLKDQEEIFTKQLEQDEKMKSKPANVLSGIVSGKINKHLADICLVDQGFVKDEKQTVAKVLAETGKAAGGTLAVAEYLYFKVGA